MSRRFFLNSEIRDGHVVLKGDQAHHAVHVMRSKAGDKLILFDGKGTEHVTLIVEVAKKELLLKIESSKTLSDFAGRDITIAVALPKGDRQKFLVEKLVEVGVNRLVPLKTTRSVSVANANAIERINRQVIEASKQCGRTYLMSVEPEQSVKNLIDRMTSHAVYYVADPSSEQELSVVDQDKSTVANVVIGPEGGFTDEELAQLQSAGWQDVRLGSTILRIETAAIAASVLLGMGSSLDQKTAGTDENCE